MENNKIFYVVPYEEYFEIVVKAILSEKGVFDEINIISAFQALGKTINISNIFVIKLLNDNYKMEIEFKIDAEEKDMIIDLINKTGYVQINK